MMKICLVGNQNSGKTTVFNLLTGLNQKIGNWPGVTVERKEGIIKQTKFVLVDLPGIYSLNSYSSEEEVSCKYILEENPDLIINIVDATCIERSLYLTTQLLELDCKIIVALNMVDLLKKKGLTIDREKLEKEIGVKICEISALKETGIENLINNIKLLEKQKNTRQYPKIYNSYLENKIIREEKNVSNRRVKAIRFLERNDEILEEEIATQRYNYISEIKKKCVKQKRRWINKSEMLDKIFMNKIFAIPIFIIIMFGIYFLSVGFVGKYTINIVEEFIEKISNNIEIILNNLDASGWVKSLIVDGIIQGVGSVLTFIPQLIILFFCISILETSGYMSRIAFLLDRLFRKIGLSGKSLIPFIIGSGCSVPGIMSTKIIENENEREMTAVLVPFIPCSAKLPIIALFSSYFFRENAGLMSASLYFLSIIIIIISAILMKKYIFVNTTSSFISELPEYKIPNLKYVIKDVYEKTISFVKRAGSTIVLASIVIWFLLSFSLDLKYGVDIEQSILAIIGKKISWIFYPILGTNSWQLAVSSIQGLIAKEQVVSSMAIISGLNNSGAIFGQEGAFNFFTPASAYAFVVFNLFSAPCFAAIGTMKKELGSYLRMIMAVLYQTLLAWSLAVIVYNIFMLCKI